MMSMRDVNLFDSSFDIMSTIRDINLFDSSFDDHDVDPGHQPF
jgi:hypothetical protein